MIVVQVGFSSDTILGELSVTIYDKVKILPFGGNGVQELRLIHSHALRG